MRRELKIVPTKFDDIRDLSCGECTACCVAFEVTEINKPDRTPCPSLKAKGCGCSIHNQRPQMCREFKCIWVQNLLYHGDVKYRPDNLGIILIRMETKPFTGITGVFPVDHTKPFPRKALSFLWEIQKTILYFDGAKEVLVGPQHLIDEWKKKWGIA